MLVVFEGPQVRLLPPGGEDAGGGYEGGEQHHAAAHPRHHVQLEPDQLLQDVRVPDDHPPGVRHSAAPVGGCTCVRPRLAGPEVPDVEDAGHGAAHRPLPHAEPGAVGQPRPRPGPGHRAGGLRPHPATQTEIVSSEANSNFLISNRCLFTLWIPLRLDNLDRVWLLMFEDGRTGEVQQIQRGPGPVAEQPWLCNNGGVMSLQYSGDNECKCDDGVGRMSGIIVTDRSSHPAHQITGSPGC